MWDSSRQRQTLSRLDTVVLVEQQEAARQQNKHSVQISSSSFSLNDWQPATLKQESCPNTLEVNGYLSFQPCPCRGLSVSGHWISLTHTYTHTHTPLQGNTLLYNSSLNICHGLLRPAERHANKSRQFPLKTLFSQTFLQALSATVMQTSLSCMTSV